MVLQSAQGTYQSAQDVVAKQNKELYPNMLDRLNKITESIHPTEAKEFINESRIRFWLKHILPLVFDEEPAVHKRAILAFEAILPLLATAGYDAHPDWPMIKENIAGPYLVNLNVLRDRPNTLWFRVWSLLLKLIQRDILRSASLINRYLNIVELGFRNPNLQVRAEAFLCWRELIELFAKSNELLAPKRIRLVCIPLKSSQSKTELIAVNKFRVWWYLITELHDHIAEHHDGIVEPFLAFCFGPLGALPLINVQSRQLPAPGKTYNALMPMAIGALVSLLGTPDESVQRLINRADMSKMRQPFNSSTLFAKMAKSIINCTAEATVVIALMKNEDTKLEIASCLWRNLVTNVNTLKCYDQFNLMLDNVDALVEYCARNPEQIPLTVHIVHQVGTADTFVHESTTDPDIERLSSCIERVAKLLMNTRIELTDTQLDEIIETWFALSTFDGRGYNVRYLLPKLLKFLSSTVNGEYSAVIRFRLWNVLRHAFVLNIDSFRGHNQAADATDIYHAFAMLPLSTNIDSFVDFKADWIALVDTMISLDPTKRSEFCQRSIEFLRTIKNKPHNEIVASLIELEETRFKTTDALPVSIFEHIETMCAATSAATTIKDLNCVALALHAYTKRLDGPELVRIYPRLRDTFVALESTVMSMRCDQAACNEFKNIVAQHMRTQKPTQHLVRLLTDEALKKELSAMQKADAGVDFVIIPSVWKFNPDRLTDQQRDKMKERRADIPALYNDNSQSQESRSIKPWTPKKLVLQESDAEPMVIEVESAAVTPTQLSEEPPSSEVTVVEVDAEPLPLSQSSNSSQGSTAAPVIEEKRKKVPPHQRELRRIHVDIVDNEFTVKSRTRNRNSTSSPAMLTKGKIKVEANDKAETKKSSDKQIIEVKDEDSHTPAVTESARKRRSTRATESSQSSNNSEPDKKIKKVANKVDETITTVIEEPETPTVEEAQIPNKSPTTLPKPNPKGSSQKENEDVIRPTRASKSNPEAQSEIEIPTKTTDLSTSIDLTAKDDDTSTQMETIDLSTEAIEASQQSPPAPVLARRSIRKSSKLFTPQSNQAPATRLNQTPSTQTMDTLPMDTECALEVMEIVRLPKVCPSPKRINLDAPTPDAEDQALAQADTEPNTQTSLTTSMLNLTNDNPDDVPLPLTPPLQPDEQVEDDANRSILCSPKCTDVDDRNAEFLNDTLNISPIHDKKTSPSPEPSTPVREKPVPKPMDDLMKPNLNSPKSRFGSPSIASIASSVTSATPTTQSCITPLQMRYQAGIQSSTPQQSSIMSTANGTTTPTPTIGSPSTSKFMQFKGRGAQLLNMINKKKELPKPDFSDTLNAPPPATESLDNNTDHTPVSVAAAHKDLLTFSKTLPSPMASPSVSILKRKYLHEPENVDDFESPASKRKRVSFHDPPVSSTKEYIGHADEHPDRTSIRPLMQSMSNSNGSPADQRSRNVLRRKSRADSMVEIAKFGRHKMPSLPGLGSNTSPPQLSNTSVDMEPLTWNTSTVSEHDTDTAAIITLDELDEIITPAPASLRFDDKAAVLQHVTDAYSLDDVLDKFEMNATTARVFTRRLSTIMAADRDTRSSVLDQLSENHPLEFLDYAVRSNYSQVVCAKLDADVVIHRAVQLAKSNESLRTTLFEDVATMAATTPPEDPALLQLQTVTLQQLSKSAKDSATSTARSQLMSTISSVVESDAETAMTDDQMRLMMRIFDRPMNDKQICECMELFSRNRRRN